MPPIAAAIGNAAERRVARCPTVNSRLISRPTTRKKIVSRPSLTHRRSGKVKVASPTLSPTSCCQNA